MDRGPRIGIFPSKEFIDEEGPFHAEEMLDPLRKLLGISAKEKYDFLVVPKLKPKTNEKLDKSERNVNVSDFTVISRNAKKRGYIDKPKLGSGVPIPSLSTKARDSQESKINSAKVSSASAAEISASNCSTTVKSSATKTEREPYAAVEIEPFIRSVKTPHPDPDVEVSKKNNADVIQECPDNIMQNLALLRNFMSKIKADPHQSIDKSKFTLFNSDMPAFPNKNCSTTAKVFCADFTKFKRRVSEINFKYY